MKSDEMKNEIITFSFGKNWKVFLENASEASIESARKDIEEWLGLNYVEGKTVLDIGCGSGIHSNCGGGLYFLPESG